tara:strand:- start:5360 stop:5536 length:177 start_codon:yes stop_codon:yes gene_type:complete
MIGIETTVARTFNLELSEYELRILFNSLKGALKDPKIGIDGPEGCQMSHSMESLLAGD